MQEEAISYGRDRDQTKLGPRNGGGGDGVVLGEGGPGYQGRVHPQRQPQSFRAPPEEGAET